MAFDQPATVPFGQRRFRHVFVLCTGRCGSMSFARACSHFTNYTAGHETNRATGPGRLDYPAGHIEVDNRLAWFLGRLDERYGDEAFYLHLLRDEDQVAASYERRWHHGTSLVRGFDESICMHRRPTPEAARDLVATVNANIRGFLRHRKHALAADIDDVAAWFPEFAAAIGAEGDLAAAVAEFGCRHNASEPASAGRPAGAEASRLRESAMVARLTERNKALKARAARLVCERSQLHDERSRLNAERSRLTAERTRLTAERAGLRARLRRARRLVRVLVAAWAVVGAALAFAVAPWMGLVMSLGVIAAWRMNRSRAGGRSRCLQWPGLPPTVVQRSHTLVYDAFRVHLTEGPERAIAILASAGPACPPGGIDLFRAMSADSDEAWLAASNAWAAAAGLPRFELRPGPEARFQRLDFAPPEPVLTHAKVSVIMPAYNAERTIEQAARSILSQSWRNLELVIVDDASGDGTVEVAERIAASDSRVRVLRNPVNVGPYVSKNRALLVATGRYVTGHDADDIALPTRIADQMQPLIDDETMAATIASMVRLDRDGLFSYPTKVGSYSYDGIARRAMISLLIERELLLERLGFWDSVRFGADSEMLARVTAVLGPRLREVRKVVMLCLDAEGSLTNNAQHGISAWEGVSPIRKAYRDAWEAWHAATPVDRRRLPFPHVDRRFAVPEGMLVPAAAMEAVSAADRAAYRRAA